LAVNVRDMTLSVRLNVWAERLREQRESGMTIRGWCKGKGFTDKTFHHWKRKLREAACEEIARSQREAKQVNLIPIGFTEIQVMEPKQQELPSLIRIGQISAEINGIRITADSEYPPDRMAVLLQRLIRPC